MCIKYGTTVSLYQVRDYRDFCYICVKHGTTVTFGIRFGTTVTFVSSMGLLLAVYNAVCNCSSVGIYLDTVNIFIRIAMILAGGGNRRK